MTWLMAGLSLPVVHGAAALQPPEPGHHDEGRRHAGEEPAHGVAATVGRSGRGARSAVLADLHRAERGRSPVAVAGLGDRSEQRVVVSAVLDQPDAAWVGLWLEARPPVGAHRLADAGLRGHDVGRVLVELLLHLLDDLDALVLVRLPGLLDVERVVALVAV